jgi:hypothetical protein
MAPRWILAPQVPGEAADPVRCSDFSPSRDPAALFFQAADDELRAIPQQDLLFGGLLLAIVDSLFFLCPSYGKILILGRDHRGRGRPNSAIQTVNNELGTIAWQDFVFRRLFLTVVYPFSFLRPLFDHLLMLSRNRTSALRETGSRQQSQRHRYGCRAKDEHPDSFQRLMAIQRSIRLK